MSINNRISRLQSAMYEIDAALFFALDSDNSNITYFSGYSGMGLLAVLRKSSFLLVPEMEKRKAMKTGIKVFTYRKRNQILEELSLLLKKHRIERVGIEEKKCTVAIYRRLKRAVKARYRDISDKTDGIRAVKDRDEIAKIKKACLMTDKVYSEIISKLRSRYRFKTEDDIREYILMRLNQEGYDFAFPPIAASGISTVNPHYNGSTILRKGFLMLDFGARFKGYCSDMTRMIYLGKPTDKELMDFQLVKKTIDECEIKKYKKFSRYYEQAVQILGDKSKYFTHSLGHGVGIDIHESPSLSAQDTMSLKDNVVFTIEPGIYQKSYGIRVEDTLIIKEGNIVRLTKSDKSLVCINWA